MPKFERRRLSLTHVGSKFPLKRQIQLETGPNVFSFSSQGSRFILPALAGDEGIFSSKILQRRRSETDESLNYGQKGFQF